MLLAHYCSGLLRPFAWEIGPRSLALLVHTYCSMRTCSVRIIGFLCLHPQPRSVLAMGPVKKEPVPERKSAAKSKKGPKKADGQTPSSKKTAAAKAKNKR